MRPAANDRAVGLTLVAVAIVWCWIAYATIPPAGLEGAPGPRLFPVLLGVSLGLLGLLLVAMSLRAAASSAQPRASQYSEDCVKRDEVVTVVSGLGLFILYGFLMDKIGFLLATPVIIVLALRVVLGIRTWFRIVLVAAGLTLGCYLAFDIGMEANLPQGRWLAPAEEE